MTFIPQRIPDDDGLFRRVHNSTRLSKRKGKDYIPSISYEFKEQECSVFWDNPYSNPFTIEQAKTECLQEDKDPRDYGIVFIEVKEVRKIKGLDVIHAPECDDGRPSIAHSNIIADSSEQAEYDRFCKYLRRYSIWKTPHPSESINPLTQIFPFLRSESP